MIFKNIFFLKSLLLFVEIIPPSLVVIDFIGCNEKVATSLNLHEPTFKFFCCILRQEHGKHLQLKRNYIFFNRKKSFA